jgi:hypothetical protein
MESQRDPLLWKQAKARVGFQMHLRSYLTINAGLWLLWGLLAFFSRDSLTTSLFPWPFFPMLGWGIGLFMHYISAYNWIGNERSMAEDEYQKLLKQSVR